MFSGALYPEFGPERVKVSMEGVKNSMCETVDSYFLLSSLCFSAAFYHRQRAGRDGWWMRVDLGRRGGLWWCKGFIQTRPRQPRNHKTPSRQATAVRVETEYQMKQTPTLPSLPHSNCLGECIWWIMKRMFLSLYKSLCFSLLYCLCLYSPSLLLFFMLCLMNSTVPPPLPRFNLIHSSSSSLFLSLFFHPLATLSLTLSLFSMYITVYALGGSPGGIYGNRIARQQPILPSFPAPCSSSGSNRPMASWEGTPVNVKSSRAKCMLSKFNTFCLNVRTFLHKPAENQSRNQECVVQNQVGSC